VRAMSKLDAGQVWRNGKRTRTIHSLGVVGVTEVVWYFSAAAVNQGHFPRRLQCTTFHAWITRTAAKVENIRVPRAR
jgi:hypothetical protein